MPLTFPQGTLLALLLPLAALSQTPDELDPHSPSTNRGEISSLPEAIKKHVMKGKASLYADFKNAVEDKVKVYLLNPSGDPVILNSQDGDIYSKREAFAPDGVWRRCDGHLYSDCGNSYGIRTVAEGEFISWTQPINTSGGTKSRIRIRLYQPAPNDLVSNEGEATVLAEEIQQCRYDLLAMQTAPFEDVAALATGEVTVKRDPNQWGDPETAAVDALDRFTRNAKVVEVLKQVQERTRVAEMDARSGKSDSLEDLGRSIYFRRYESALRVFASPMLYSAGDGEVWFHLEGQFRDKTNPWRSEVLRWMLNQPFNGGEKLHPLLESTLAEPGHPALEVALRGLPKAYLKEKSGALLRAAMTHPNYRASDRLAARDTYEMTFANPFVTLKTHAGFSSIEHVDPIKGFTVTNISPQAVRLPCKDLRQLLIVRVTLSDGQEFSSPAPRPGPLSPGDELVLEPGKSLQAGEVKWWELVKLPRPFPGDQFHLSLAFATPGLWDLPARDNTSFWMEGKAIERAQAGSPP